MSESVERSFFSMLQAIGLLHVTMFQVTRPGARSGLLKRS